MNESGWIPGVNIAEKAQKLYENNFIPLYNYTVHSGGWMCEYEKKS